MRTLQCVVAVMITLGLAIPASGQGRVRGFVEDSDGRPIKGATVLATSEDTSMEWAATTDDEGRFVMLGLHLGFNWEFLAAAPGFYAVRGGTRVRATFGRPLRFALEPLPGPPPGALSKDILEEIADAQELRVAGKYEQAVSAYQEIQRKNYKLSFVHLVLAGMYRERAEQEQEPAARQALLERAATAYREALADSDAEHTHAARELAVVTDAIGAVE